MSRDQSASSSSSSTQAATLPSLVLFVATEDGVLFGRFSDDVSCALSCLQFYEIGQCMDEDSGFPTRRIQVRMIDFISRRLSRWRLYCILKVRNTYVIDGHVCLPQSMLDLFLETGEVRSELLGAIRASAQTGRSRVISERWLSPDKSNHWIKISRFSVPVRRVIKAPLVIVESLLVDKVESEACSERGRLVQVRHPKQAVPSSDTSRWLCETLRCLDGIIINDPTIIHGNIDENHNSPLIPVSLFNSDHRISVLWFQPTQPIGYRPKSPMFFRVFSDIGRDVKSTRMRGVKVARVEALIGDSYYLTSDNGEFIKEFPLVRNEEIQDTNNNDDEKKSDSILLHYLKLENGMVFRTFASLIAQRTSLFKSVDESSLMPRSMEFAGVSLLKTTMSEFGVKETPHHYRTLSKTMFGEECLMHSSKLPCQSVGNCVDHQSDLNGNVFSSYKDGSAKIVFNDRTLVTVMDSRISVDEMRFDLRDRHGFEFRSLSMRELKKKFDDENDPNRLECIINYLRFAKLSESEKEIQYHSSKTREKLVSITLQKTLEILES